MKRVANNRASRAMRHATWALSLAVVVALAGCVDARQALAPSGSETASPSLPGSPEHPRGAPPIDAKAPPGLQTAVFGVG